MDKKSLGVIGIGQFAEFFIPFLKPHFSQITIASRSDKSEIARKLHVSHSDIKTASQKNYVILAMPISETKSVLKEIKSHVKPTSVIMDVCSVKTYPAKLMLRALSENINILGTHPLFGPQSGKNGIKGLDIVICPVRISDSLLKNVKNIFKAMGLNIIETTPEHHDKIMASTQALTHFFAKGVLRTIHSDKFAFSTPSSKRLFSIINDVKDDSERLFRDIENLNPYSKGIRKKLIKNLIDIDKQL